MHLDDGDFIAFHVEQAPLGESAGGCSLPSGSLEKLTLRGSFETKVDWVLHESGQPLLMLVLAAQALGAALASAWSGR